jgi:hypothetical protein
MKAGQRANVASSFTLIKGAMIEETYAVFAAWDLALSKRQNLGRLREQNFIGASSTAWLRDVAKVLNRRFDPDGRDKALVVLAKNACDLDEWKPLLLWHITRDEFSCGISSRTGSSPPTTPAHFGCGPRSCTTTFAESGSEEERRSTPGLRPR